jgi:hypothetical protein
VRDENNTAIPFNVENAMKLFAALPDLYADLLAQSDKVSNFRSETAEGDAKN